jgi:hypothetical protein
MGLRLDLDMLPLKEFIATGLRDQPKSAAARCLEFAQRDLVHGVLNRTGLRGGSFD